MGNIKILIKIFRNIELDNNKKEEKLNVDFDEIDEGLTAGWYVVVKERDI